MNRRNAETPMTESIGYSITDTCAKTRCYERTEHHREQAEYHKRRADREEQEHQLTKARLRETEARLRDAEKRAARVEARARIMEGTSKELRSDLRRAHFAMEAAGVTTRDVPGGFVVTAATLDTIPPGVEPGRD